ncbi:MAG: GAF domain-containing protein [Microscillaceae bacterium]|nr:GAF domain-containing protein [Microscillaceae bacterium]
MNPFKFNSIKSQLVQFFLLLCLVAAAGIIFTQFQTQKLNQLNENITGIHHHINHFADKLEAEVNYLAFLSYDYFALNQSHVKARINGIWENRILTYSDSLSRLAQLTGDLKMEQQAYEIRKEIIKLKPYWTRLLTENYAEDQKNKWIKLDKEYDLLINRIRKQLQIIGNESKTSINFDGVQLTENIQRTQIFLTIFILLILVLGFLTGLYLINKTLQNHLNISEKLQSLREGNLSTKIENSIEEFQSLVFNTNELIDTFSRLKDMATEVSNGKYDTHIKVFDNKGILGNALSSMRSSLQKISIENRERNWMNEGYAKFAEILRNSSRDSDSTVFYENVISSLVRYLDIHQGGIFALNDESKDRPPFMELKATYAFERKKYLIRHIPKEEGLIGQAWREKDIILITDVPYNYSHINSGLGQFKPKSILIAPLITNEQVLGVIELASMKPIQPVQIAFIERLSESIATTIARLKVDVETGKLLDESRFMAERMRSQEEEMMQSMEELVATQEKMELNSNEMRTQLKALNGSFIMMEMNTQGFFIKVNELLLKTTGYSTEEILNQHYTILYNKKATPENTIEDWEDVLRGNYIRGEFLRYRKNGEPFWLYEVMYPLFNTQGEIYKVCIVGYDISKQKEQEQKIKEQLNELYMSKRDVVNRIREIEGKARNKITKLKLDFNEQIKEKDRIIAELKQES